MSIIVKFVLEDERLKLVPVEKLTVGELLQSKKYKKKGFLHSNM